MLVFKKHICFLIIASMLSFTAAFAEDTQQSAVGAADEAAVEIGFLKTVGVIDENDMRGEYKPADTVTRAEFAYMAVKMSALPQGLAVPEEGTGFSDVEAGKWSSPYIYAAKETGIVSASSDGSFNPDQPVLYEQAVKMLICLLGYNVKAEMSGGYPIGYISVAREKGIGVKKNLGSELTKSDAAKMAFQALNTPVLLQETYSGGKIEFTSYENRTLLNENMSVYKGEGIVYDDGFTRVGGRSGVGNNMVGIKTKDGAVSTYDNNANLNISSLLGSYVVYFYKGEDDESLIYLYPHKNNSVLKIRSQDIEKYEDNVYTYLDEEGNRQTAETSPIYDVIFNGEAYLPTSNSDMIPTDGSVSVIDNNGDGLFDIVIISDYRTLCVETVISDTKSVRDKYRLNNADLDGDKVRIFKNGQQITFDDIEKWDVLSVAESKSSGSNKVIVVYVSSDYFDGKITEKSDEDYLYIDGKEYQIANNLKTEQSALNALEIDKNYSFHIDFEGRIAAVEEDIFDVEDYVYLTNIAPKSAISNIVDLKVFTKNNMFEKLSSSARLRVDGEVLKKGSDIYAMLGGSGKSISPQLIRIERNDKGEVIVIDSAKPDKSSAPNELVLSGSGSATYKDTNKIFGGMFAINDVSTVYSVPSDISDEELFSYKRVSELTNGTYSFVAYNIGDTGIAKAVVVSGTAVPEIGNDDLVGVVIKKTTIIDEKGEEKIKLYFMQNNAEKSYILNKYATYFDGRPANEVNQGDTIRYFLDPVSQTITHLAIHLDYSKRDQQISQASSTNPDSASTQYNVLLRFVYGEVVSRTGQMLKIRLKVGTEYEIYYFSMARAVLTLCTEIGGGEVKVKKGTVNDIRDFDTVGDYSKTTKIFMRQRYGEVMDAVIYNPAN